MIECIFTIDYEIYGNGQGSLRELVYAPTKKLVEIFHNWNAFLVFFVEVAELERIEEYNTDDAIRAIMQQVRELYMQGFEIGLHLHPQWYNARFENGKWLLDYREYNLCELPKKRIYQIVDQAISYFRESLGVADFTPFSFRAGNWLFQPTQDAANVLAERGIKVDSSVFKGGLQRQHKMDYRRALSNGYYWPFSDNVNVSDPNGKLLELPIYTQMVPCWKMLTSKRMGIQRTSFSTVKSSFDKIYRLLNLTRFKYPLKLDFCRMTVEELIRMFDCIIQEDQDDPASFRPIVAIGHTKDLTDFETIEFFLSYLRQKKIAISTFNKIYPKCE
jgi:hypothetical protein